MRPGRALTPPMPHVSSKTRTWISSPWPWASHAMTTRDAALDLDLIRDLAREVPVPLVLHGSSGVSDENMALAIQAGMTKINVSTHLNKVYTHTARATLESKPDVVDTRKWTAPASEALSAEVARLLTHYQSVSAG